MSSDPIPSPALSALDRAARTARAELVELTDARRRAVAALAGTWVGGHHDRFAADLAALERRVRDRIEVLDGLLRALARAAEAPGVGA